MAGTLLSIEVERQVAGLPAANDSSQGVIVREAFTAMDAMALSLGVTPLDAFYNYSDWYPAEDGLATVRALVAKVAGDPTVPLIVRLSLDKLRVWEEVLAVVAAAGVRWRVRAELA